MQYHGSAVPCLPGADSFAAILYCAVLCGLVFLDVSFSQIVPVCNSYTGTGPAVNTGYEVGLKQP